MTTLIGPFFFHKPCRKTALTSAKPDVKGRFCGAVLNHWKSMNLTAKPHQPTILRNWTSPGAVLMQCSWTCARFSSEAIGDVLKPHQLYMAWASLYCFAFQWHNLKSSELLLFVIIGKQRPTKICLQVVKSKLESSRSFHKLVGFCGGDEKSHFFQL